MRLVIGKCSDICKHGKGEDDFVWKARNRVVLLLHVIAIRIY